MLALAQTPLVAPALLFVLVVVAAVGIIVLLPGRRETPLRKIGGVILIATGLVFAAILAQAAAGMGAFFWIFSAIAIFAAVRVVTHTRPVYSALYFVLTVMASAGLFVLMWAQFMAAALVLIYAGAILVTYVFVIMLASEAAPAGSSRMHEQLAEHDAVSREPVIASAVGFALIGVLIFVIFDRADGMSLGRDAQATSTIVTNIGWQPVGNTQRLGAYLFDKHLINLELAGLILTVAMVGAIVIARKQVIHIGIASQTGAPQTPPVIDDNPHSIPVVGTENPRQKEFPET